MKNVALLFFLSFFFICQNGISQINPEVLTKQGNKYYFQTRFYAKKEFGTVLESNSEAYKIHKEYFRDRKKLRIWTVISIGTLVIWDKWQKQMPDSDKGLGKVLISLPIIIIPPTVTVVKFFKVIGKNKKAVRIFNEDLAQIPKIGYLPIELDFGNTNNGIGLVLSF